MLRVQAEVVLDVACTLGEGPVWWDGCFWFVDIEQRALHQFDPATYRHTLFQVPGRIGFAVPRAQGDWLIAQDASVALFRPGKGEPGHGVQMEPNDHGTRMNDGKCDPMGRLYAGSMHLGANDALGALYRFKSDGRPTRLATGVTISNGLAWDAHRKTMYYIDTPTHRIDAFDWCPDTGDVRNRRPVATLEGGSPDGMCIDRDGGLWVAMWGGSRVAHVDPESGREVGAVVLPCSNVTSCCFGGDALDQLWITTARNGLDDAALDKQPLAGGVFVADVAATGWPTTPMSAPLARG